MTALQQIKELAYQSLKRLASRSSIAEDDMFGDDDEYMSETEIWYNDVKRALDSLSTDESEKVENT